MIVIDVNKVDAASEGIHRFVLYRGEDETGVSGTGVVAGGVAFPNGKCVVSWFTAVTSVAVYDSIAAVRAIHGHGGKTRIVWLDPHRYVEQEDS